MSPLTQAEREEIKAAVKDAAQAASQESIDRPLVATWRSLWPLLSSVVFVTFVVTVQWVQLNARLDKMELALVDTVKVQHADAWVDTFAAWNLNKVYVPNFRNIRSGEYPELLRGLPAPANGKAPDAADYGAAVPIPLPLDKPSRL